MERGAMAYLDVEDTRQFDRKFIFMDVMVDGAVEHFNLGRSEFIMDVMVVVVEPLGRSASVVAD
jgi:hypothetical protein